MLKENGEYYSSKEIDEKINNFKNINCEKIYAFTDHFSLIYKFYCKDKLEEYRKKFKELFEKYSKKNINILIGLEIDVHFNDDSPKHLICLFQNENDWFNKIENYSSKEEHLTPFYFSDKPKSWLELLKKTVCIPHYLKQEERSFTKEQISTWNRSTEVPQIKCLEIASNLKNYFYFLSDKEINDNYHCIVANDRVKSLLGSFICFDDHTNKTTNYRENLFDIIFEFFNQSRHKTSLSTKFIEYEVLLNDIGISVNLNKNCLVYGKRGSGKSYLCELLNKAFVGSNIQGEQENSKICYIKQGDYIKEKNWEVYCRPFRDKMQNILTNCCQIFKDVIADAKLNFQKYDKKTIDGYCNNQIKKFVKEIGDNERDGCQHLRAMDDLYRISSSSYVSDSWIEKYNIYEEFIGKINDIFNRFEKIKKFLNDHNDDVEKIINNLYNKKPYFLQKLEVSYIWKEIICYRKKIIERIQDHIKEKKNWEHNLDFDFFQYFKVILLKEQFNKFIDENKEIIENITSEWNEKYQFKYTMEPNGYFQIKELKDPILSLWKKDNFVSASDGEQREFLILNKLSKSDATFFILDEPEYAFDNVFLKKVLAKKIREIISNKSKHCWIITHNHVLWSEIFEKKDNATNKHIVKDVAYIECKYNNGKISYEQKLNNEGCDFMGIFEADDKSYDLRHNFYFKEGGK